jgi:hypothetical protein
MKMRTLFASLLLTFVGQPDAATACSGRTHPDAQAGRVTDLQERLVSAMTGRGLDYPAATESPLDDRDLQTRLVAALLGSDLQYPVSHHTVGPADIQSGIIASLAGR